jgi:hypothetical protein
MHQKGNFVSSGNSSRIESAWEKCQKIPLRIREFIFNGEDPSE